jgi:hypothetical protein
MERLVYFALSIFWRGAVHEWEADQGRTPFKVELCGYEEPIRQYLLGLAPVPSEVALTVMIWPYTKSFIAGLVPRPAHQRDFQRYWFFVCGLGFVLNFGENLPTDVKRTCSYHSPQKIITVSKEFANDVIQLLRDELRSSDLSKLDEMLKEISAIRSTGSSTAK